MNREPSKTQLAIKLVTHIVVYTVLITFILSVTAFVENELEDYVIGPDIPPMPPVYEKPSLTNIEQQEVMNSIGASTTATESDIAGKMNQIPKKETVLTAEERLKILQGN